jgi:hypothetical protein
MLSPFGHPLALRVPHPFPMCLFFSSCLFIIQFVFFPEWESVCPVDYADLAQGCLWEYRVPLNSPGGLLLSSRLGTGVGQCESPPDSSVQRGVEMLCVDLGCGGVGVLLLLGCFSCKVFSSVSPRFHFRKHAFGFLPLVAILESLLKLHF